MPANCFPPLLLLLLLLVVVIQSSYPSTAATTLPSDVAALAAFKSAITPSSINPWSCLASWNFTSDPCRPLNPSHFTCGLTCTGAGRISSITLDPAGYSGELSPALSSLSSLAHLDLYDNNFHGPLPSSLSSLPSLTTLVLSSNSFSGEVPPSFADFAAIQTLDLSHNQLAGRIPAFPPKALSALTSLDLSFNRLSGPIPASLPSNLIVLALRSNSLSGGLNPSTFRSLKLLEIAELAANKFTGKIGGWFFLLPSLQQVNLANNSISSIEVFTPKPTVDEGKQLVAVDLSFNSIAGTLPAEFAAYPALASLSASHNKLRGQIPWQYGNKGRMRRLFLDSNFLNGEVPDSLLNKGDLAGSFGDNCLAKCPRSVPLCSPVQKPGWVCKQAYGDGGRRGLRRPAPARG